MDDFTDYHAESRRSPSLAWWGIGAVPCIAFWAVLVGVML